MPMDITLFLLRDHSTKTAFRLKFKDNKNEKINYYENKLNIVTLIIIFSCSRQI